MRGKKAKQIRKLAAMMLDSKTEYKVEPRSGATIMIACTRKLYQRLKGAIPTGESPPT